MTTAIKQSEEVSPPELTTILEDAEGYFENNLNIDSDVAKTAAVKLRKFIIEEEYDYEAISADFDDGYTNSELVHILSEVLHEKDEDQLQKIELKLKILFKLVRKSVPHIFELNWEISTAEKVKARAYINEQCPNMIKDGQNESMIFIIAVGNKNGIPNLLTLLYDAYTMYNNKHRMAQKKNGIFIGYEKYATDFCDTFLQGLSKFAIQAIAHSLSSFGKRVVPAFKFRRGGSMISDSCDIFIDYTIMVTRALKNYVTFTKKCLPLQADLVIIPKRISQQTENDLFEEEDYKEVSQELTDKELTFNAEAYATIINDVLQGKNTKYSKDTIFTSLDSKVLKVKEKDITRKITNLISEYVNGQHFKRISIVIDRRPEPNLIYVYALPGNMSEILHGYCLTSMVYSSARFVMPRMKPLENGRDIFIGGLHDKNAHFQISYQWMEDDQVRMQWFHLGTGMRLYPEIMVNLWPSAFLKDSVDGKYTVEYVKEHLGIEDCVFETWNRKFVECM